LTLLTKKQARSSPALKYNGDNQPESNQEEDMNRLLRLSISIWILAALSACNLPSGQPTQDPNAVFTAAAQTVEAQLTLSAPQPTESGVAAPTETSVPGTATLVPPTATTTPLCDLAFFVTDVTVPDGTEFAPGTAFIKTWRLRNTGTCTWTGYTLVFDSGDAMGGPASQPIGTVAPGQEVDLSVNLVAPATEKTYRGYWRIKNASGVLLPVSNGYQGRSFFVEIKVKPATTSVTLNATGGTEGGTVYEPAAGLAVVHGTILVGDTSGNHLARGYMSFNISALSGTTIISAQLDLTGCTVTNNPFGGLSGIWVGEVQYGLPLEQASYNIAGTGIVLLNSAPAAPIDVKTYVQNRVTEGKSRFQIRLHPAGPSNANGTADYFSCGATTPKLTITYQP
jgi:hypothetical protein